MLIPDGMGMDDEDEDDVDEAVEEREEYERVKGVEMNGLVEDTLVFNI